MKNDGSKIAQYNLKVIIGLGYPVINRSCGFICSLFLEHAHITGVRKSEVMEPQGLRRRNQSCLSLLLWSQIL